MRAEAAALLRLLLEGAAPTADVEPERLVDLARAHQVDALAHACWPRAATTIPAAHEAFRLAYLRHLLRNGHLVTNLEDLETALYERGVESLVFKGPWLAFAAWPDPGARPVDDIDLAVRERDYRGAVDALEALGYRAAAPLPRDPGAALRQAHYGRQLRFAAPRRRPVELHFRLINMGPPSAGEPWLWQEARVLPLGKRAIRVPGPADMLLHLVLHANQHGFAVLRLLFDIRFALARIDVAAATAMFLERIRELRCGTVAFYGFELARELAGAAPPEALSSALRPGWLRRGLFEHVWGIECARGLEKPRGAMRTESPLLYLWEMGRLRDKARYLRGFVSAAGGPRRCVRLALEARQAR